MFKILNINKYRKMQLKSINDLTQAELFYAKSECYHFKNKFLFFSIVNNYISRPWVVDTTNKNAMTSFIYCNTRISAITSF